jgi:ABC-2 type transport system permease protein
MRVYATLVRRELAGYFLSLTGYILIATVVLLVGLAFTVMLVAYNDRSSDAPLTEMFYSTMFFWLILLVATPIMTMRLFAQEKSSGTFETLMTAPVKELEVVLAKFTAGLLFYVVTWLPLVVSLRLVHGYAGQGASFDWRPVASTFLGIVFLGGLFVAMGCLASALTRSQIVAAIIGLGLGLSLFLLSFLKYSVSPQGGWMAQVTAQFCLMDHMEDFVRGVVDTRRLTFYLSFTAFFLFLTVKAVESRRWK